MYTVFTAGYIVSIILSSNFYICAMISSINSLKRKDMAGTITAMSRLKQALQLHKEGLSNRFIASSLGLHKDTINKYVRQYKDLSVDVSELLKKDDPEVERLFNAGRPAYSDKRFDELAVLLPDLQNELGKRYVTRRLLWEEYLRGHPDGYGFTQFCFHLKQHMKASPASTVLANTYKAGEKVYVDFAGTPMEYIDPNTGEIVKVQTFVACLPYTDYAFAICVPSQKSEDFLYALTKLFNFLGGVPRIVVPDNLKAAVTRSDRYEPQINTLMEQMGNHYGFVTIPARPAHPKDKALVENQIKLVYRRVYAPLRNQTFFSLEALNKAVSEQVHLHNRKRMQQRSYSRQEHFVADEKQTLRPLPEINFEVQYDTELTVSANCCVYLGRDQHYYSVPYQHIGQKVKLVYTRSLVKIYHRGERIATHIRRQGFGHSIQEDHLAPHSRMHHKRSAGWYMERAGEKSTLLRDFVEKIFSSSPQPPEFFYKRCEGLMRLARVTPTDDLEQACRIAIENDQYTYTFMERVLRNLKMISDVDLTRKNPVPDNHENIRGAEYYN
jgi:transposase